jgi:transcriptional regulator with XRE-family HTH domain
VSTQPDTPVPARITDALDAAGLHGPEVDRALGVEEPMVDDWESGRSVPTATQIQRLAMLTGVPVARFCRPVEDWERHPARHFLCDRSQRPENALTIVETWINQGGVRRSCELTPPKPPSRRRAPKPRSERDQHHPHCPTKTGPVATCGVCQSIHKGEK